MTLWNILEILFILMIVIPVTLNDYDKAKRQRDRELVRKKQLERLNDFGIPIKELSRDGYIETLRTLRIIEAWKKEKTPKQPIRSPYAGLAPWIILDRFMEKNLDKPEVILQEFNRLKFIQAKLDKSKQNDYQC
ncbi:MULTISPECIES: hypothetical protein [unclassified Campylobacter]|nr:MULTISPECIES: hypothetical protein [unclassified Campylobacter]MDA3089984.1 hypothetical protein [Campylobacter sp. CS_ED2]MDA3079109.1 hypothetical protein [Campylobacter sp. CS_NA2]MDA3080588.1 hypothetical protein [Campylobacter sp. CS_NA1]MDA3085207.1 hypothetical protein [Campylobacter sp. CS_ED1]WBR51473.1 hypothetical protein PF026_01130 [Campylobacter sp. CS_NA3]